jgi:membrane associated rhomboid family serine protease
MRTDISDEKKLFRSSVFITVMVILLLWLVWFLDIVFNLQLSRFGVHPHQITGLLGILFMPFIHSTNGISHLLYNSISLLVLGTILLNTYPRVALKTVLIIQLLSGFMVWFFASANQYHIGASGVIFGIAAFLFASGILRRDRVSIAVALFVGLFYGSSILNGLFPTEPNISWQGHLAGIVAGLFCAFLYRNVDLPIDTTFEEEETYVFSEDDPHFFEEVERDKRSILKVVEDDQEPARTDDLS